MGDVVAVTPLSIPDERYGEVIDTGVNERPPAEGKPGGPGNWSPLNDVVRAGGWTTFSRRRGGCIGRENGAE